MASRKFLILMCLVFTGLSLSWGIDAGWGQTAKGTAKANMLDQLLQSRGKITLTQKKTAANTAATLGLQPSLTAATLVTDPAGHLVPDYFGVANWAFSPPLAKFKDALPMLVTAVPDTTTYPGSDYYEIELGQFTLAMHSSLPPTTLRGYRQVNTTDPAASQFSYLGPVIVAQKDRPVRIKFINNLPTGAGGNLFIPVDNTIMGAGMGPDGMTEYTQNRGTVHLHGNNSAWISDGTPHQWITPATETTPYPQGVSVHNVPDMPDPGPGAMTLFYSNALSARLMFYHDHAYGITRLNVYAGEAAGYLITDQVESDLINGTNVTGVNPGGLKVLPDTGITLVLQDKTFVDPATIGTTDPTWLDPTQPTFGTTPGTANLGDLWYPHVYLPNQNPWAPDGTGANPFGRWDYGPWFYPPVPPNAMIQGILPNPYCQPTPPASSTATTWDCSSAPWEPPFMPGTPSLSEVGEGFMDTPIVNGKAYPYLVVEPRAYRFRILNAADDRFFNLQMYVANRGIVGRLATRPGSGYTADPMVAVTNAAGDTTGHGFTLSATADLNQFLADGVTPNPTYGQVSFAINSVGSNYTLPPVITVTPAAGDTTGTGATARAVLYTKPTEVGMVPTPEITLPNFDLSGVPDPGMAGPSWWHIGTEGGFLPAPVVVPNQHITWNMNPKTFNFGNVVKHALLLGTAERADVVVDFSAFAGQTIILYNDAPAAFPAIDPRVDYYTNDQDQTTMGGAPTTPPGFGPNTRTVMQIRVKKAATTTTPDVTLANLQSVWAAAPGKPSVFEASQDPIIIPQAAYNSAYNNTFTSSVANEYIQIGETSKTFQPIDQTGALQPAVTVPIEEKATHDEMGGVYDRYGRMSGMLGLSLPATTSQLAQFIPYGYASPPVDLYKGSVAGTLVGSLGDGTQIWRITQNGVDTHTIHVHLFNAQLINRVGWDGMMIPPDPSELGWKETFRVNPLEQTFIALRPILPTSAQIPFIDQVPNSVRLIDPTMPEGAVLTPPPPAGWSDPNGNQIADILNHYVNYGWEYVYHCHILAHEENDMMHATGFVMPPNAPSGLTASITGSGTTVVLRWTDNSPNETGFTVQRATNTGFTSGLTEFTVGPNVTIFRDPIGTITQTYYYRVFASNLVGDAATPGFPTMTAKSGFSNTARVKMPAVPPAAPSNVAAATSVVNSTNAQVTVTWTDNSTNETGFRIQMATSPLFTTGVVSSVVGANIKTFTTPNLPRGATYYFRVQAYNAAGASVYVNAVPFPITTP